MTSRQMAARLPRSPISRINLLLAALVVLGLTANNPTAANEGVRNLFIFAILISAIVGLHEMSHLLAARAFKIRVLSFAIGFGPELLKADRWGIHWSLNLLPFGGFVKLHGEDADVGPDSFVSAAPWKRILVLLAGPVSNLIAAFATLMGMALVSGVALAEAPGKAMLALLAIWNATVDAIASYLPHAASAPLDVPFSGIPGMVSASGLLLDQGVFSLFLLVAALNLSLGIMNLLPIPPMDGGQATLIGGEAVMGRFYPKRLARMLQVGGLAFMVVLMVFINGVDLLRMLLGQGALFSGV